MATGRRNRPARDAAGPAIAAALAVLAAPALALGAVPPPPSSLGQRPAPEPREDMSEALRAEVDAVVVVATRNPAAEDVGGSYEKDSYGLMGGAIAGHEAGRIRKEMGPVPVDFRIPGTAIPGAIIGGLFGSVQREVQDLRDALTEELADAASTPLTDDGLAMDVFWGLRQVPALDSKIIAPTAPVPEADAMLHVNFGGVAIDVQGSDAVITTTAIASLRRLDNDAELYHTVVHYRDRDSLRNWTAEDNRLWHAYVSYARHYLGREVAARVYSRIELPQTLSPGESKTMRRDRRDRHHFVSKTPQPELVWTIDAADAAGTPWAGKTAALDEPVTWYDVEIYDRDRLVLFGEDLPEPRYAVPSPLECGDYRWSVRPSWRVDGIVRYGRWMRFPPPRDASEDDEENAGRPVNGLDGRAASDAPAYTQDFPSLTVACR